MSSWASWNALTGLHHHQFVVDHLRSFPEWNETLQLRNIIALDIDALCAQLFNIIHASSHYRALSNLRDKEAQAMLNLMQNVRRYQLYTISIQLTDKNFGFL